MRSPAVGRLTKHARCFLVVAAICLPSASQADETQDLDGLTIVSIRIDCRDIFDTSHPKTSSWFHRWANALHIVTKEGFVRSLLLFEEGDPYSASAASESARMLRALGIVNPVEIRAGRVDGGVEVTVETRDRWSLEPGGHYGVSGGRTTYGITIEESNLMGWGKSIAVDYDSEIERESWSYRYFDPLVLKSRWRLLLAHASLSDGSRDHIRIERPFFSLTTRWSWGVEAQTEDLIDHLYADSESVVSGRSETERLRTWLGVRLPGKGDLTRRLFGGWVHQRDRYADWVLEPDTPVPSPEDLLVSGPSIGFEQVADRFVVVEGFQAWAVQEDVALGPNFSVSSTISSPRFGGDRDRLLWSGGGHAARRRGGWLLLGDAWLSGRLDEGESRNVLAGLQVGAARLGPRGWQVRLLAEGSHALDTDRQLTLGADIGLRGWEPDSFDGTSRALLNVQWRSLIKKDVFGLFSVGGVVFTDAGTTSGSRIGRDTDGIRVNAGVGLLFDLANLSRTNLLRIDLAFPDDGSGPILTVDTSSIFRLRRSSR
jgi:hypothetical protein